MIYKVHIMLATYNGEKYLREQIDSILAQTYTDWSLYISDDGSDDTTPVIIEEYTDRYPDKIFSMNKSRIGGARKNFIYLFEKVPTADLYMFSDQDDIWLPDKIKKMVEAYDRAKSENTLLYSDLTVVDSELNTISETFISDLHYSHKKEFMMMNNYIPGCVMMLDDKMISSVGKIPKECIMHDWWIAMYATYIGSIIPVNEKLHLYRQHDQNAIGANQDNLNGDLEKAVKKLKKRKRQNNQFLKEYVSQLSDRDVKLFKRYNRMCNNEHSIKAVAAFILNFRTKKIGNDIVYMKAIFNRRI